MLFFCVCECGQMTSGPVGGLFKEFESELFLGKCHYLAGGGGWGGEGHYFWGDHNFFPSCLGRVTIFFKFL